MTAALVAFGVVFVAELGDKSQLLALTLATRYRALPVLAGLALAAAGLMMLAVAAGAALSAALPTAALSVVAGLAFLVFAVLTLRSPAGQDDAELTGAPRQPGVVPVAGAFAVAELGDKTMLATLALAANNGAVGTWFGATAGMVAASSLAVLVGSQLGTRLPERVVRVGAAVMFAAFGMLLLADGLL